MLGFSILPSNRSAKNHALNLWAFHKFLIKGVNGVFHESRPGILALEEVESLRLNGACAHVDGQVLGFVATAGQGDTHAKIGFEASFWCCKPSAFFKGRLCDTHVMDFKR